MKKFTKAPIFYHFDPKRHINIETKANGFGSKIFQSRNL